MNYKKYIFSIAKFILIAFLIFVFAVFHGYFFAQNSPSETGLILEELQEMLGPVLEMSSLSQFLFIVLNNSMVAFLVIVLGIVFGIFPFLVLIANGTILGIMVYLARTELSWSSLLVSVLPHGIIEIPIIILACAVGFKLGKTLFDKLFGKKKSLKEELSTALSLFLKFLFPFLAVAAIIEVFLINFL